MISLLFFGALTAVWLGGVCYCLLALWAAWRFRSASKELPAEFTPFASLLKPLCGLERDLEKNLETFFTQDYPSYEILFAVNFSDDLALTVVERLRKKYPRIPVKVVFAVDSPYPNLKVYSLELMGQQAGSDLLVISDSDVFVGPDYLRTVVRPFANHEVGVNTCVYRGSPGNSLWSRLEAMAMGIQFMPGVLVAWGLDGMKFALGPTMALRRNCLEAIGGFSSMSHYLADDFVLGNWAAEAGFRVVLSPYVLNHQVLGESFRSTFEHRLRWARSSRCSRPLGYIGEGFTHPLAVALGLMVLTPHSLLFQAMVAATVLLRWMVSWAVGWVVLRDRSLRRWWWWLLIPLQDVLSFAVWCGGFTSRKIHWRGITYRVEQDGRFEPVEPALVDVV